MLAPCFIKNRFVEGTQAKVWFRNHAKGGIPGVVLGWEEHNEELSSYVLFQTLDDDELYLPFADIYLSVMTGDSFEAAKDEFKLAKQFKEVQHRELSAKCSGLA